LNTVSDRDIDWDHLDGREDDPRRSESDEAQYMAGQEALETMEYFVRWMLLKPFALDLLHQILVTDCDAPEARNKLRSMYFQGVFWD
jgi:hypothetical protein